MSITVPCALGCDKPVDPLDHTTFQRVIGWERKAGVRASGKHGGSDIVGRKTLNEFAHSQCVYRERDTGSAAQGVLLREGV
jgi:hypothetical protein